MRSALWIALSFIVLAVGAVLGRPEARADEPSCSDVPSESEEACNAESKAKCSGLKPTPRIACEGAIARKLIPCLSADYEAMCKAVDTLSREVCSEPRGLVLSEPKTLEAWKGRLDRLLKSGAPWKEYKAKYGECYRTSRYAECTASASSAFDTCEAAPAEYKGSYVTLVDQFLNSTFVSTKETVATDLKKESFVVAREVVKLTTATAKLLVDVALAAPSVKHRGDELAAAVTALAGMDKDIEAAREKALASRRCPAGKAPNPKLLAALKPVVVDHMKGGETLTESVEVLRLDGKPVLSSEPLMGLTHEDAPLVACVKQVAKLDGAATCRIFNMTVRRTKAGGGPWGAWAFYSIGGGDELLCKNVK